MFTENTKEVFEQIEHIEEIGATFVSDLTNIQNDIEKNIVNIIKNIRIEPFKAILSKYGMKVNSVEDFIQKNFG